MVDFAYITHTGNMSIIGDGIITYNNGKMDGVFHFLLPLP